MHKGPKPADMDIADIATSVASLAAKAEPVGQVPGQVAGLQEAAEKSSRDAIDIVPYISF